MPVRKYSSSKIDTVLSELLRVQKCKESFTAPFKDENSSITFFLFLRNKKWDSLTRAVGAIAFVKNADDLPRDGDIYFDLFYDGKDLSNFWKTHQNPFEIVEIRKDQIKKLSECSKELDTHGNEVPEGSVSEWVTMYTLSTFVDKGWATFDEFSDCINQSNTIQLMLELESQGEVEILLPKEDLIEINFIIRNKNNA